MTNLPIKDNAQGEEVKCEPTEKNGLPGFLVYNSNGYRIEVLYGTPEGIANQIARLVTDARDRGFEQGLRSVRIALGCKPND